MVRVVSSVISESPGAAPSVALAYIVQCLASLLVPDDSCLSLVGNANGLDALLRMPILFEYLQSSFYTVLDRLHDLLGVMLVPTTRCVKKARFLRQRARLTLGLGRSE